MGGRRRLRGAPAECFGIKYRFNYLRERFIALRKCAEKKTASDVCLESVFLGKLIMGASEESFQSLSYGNLFGFSCITYKDVKEYRLLQ